MSRKGAKPVPENAALLPEQPAAAPQPEITLHLTTDEVAIVLGALGICAYDLVSLLVAKINGQAIPQAEAIGTRMALAAMPADSLGRA